MSMMTTSRTRVYYISPVNSRKKIGGQIYLKVSPSFTAIIFSCYLTRNGFNSQGQYKLLINFKLNFLDFSQEKFLLQEIAPFESF